MANEVDMLTAQKVYRTICNALDGMNLTYKKHKELIDSQVKESMKYYNLI